MKSIGVSNPESVLKLSSDAEYGAQYIDYIDSRKKLNNSTSKYILFDKVPGYVAWASGEINMKGIYEAHEIYKLPDFIYKNVEWFLDYMIEDTSSTPIEFHTGNKITINGVDKPVDKSLKGNGGGVAVQHSDGRLEIVVNPRSFSDSLKGYYIWGIDAITLHEFGHAFAVVWGYKYDSVFSQEMAMLFEAQWRIKNGYPSFRNMHNPHSFLLQDIKNPKVQK